MSRPYPDLEEGSFCEFEGLVCAIVLTAMPVFSGTVIDMVQPHMHRYVRGRSLTSDELEVSVTQGP